MQSLALTTTKKMGWIPDLPDHRDHYVTFKTIDAPKEKTWYSRRSEWLEGI